MDILLCKSHPDQHAERIMLQLQGNMDISFISFFTIQSGNDPMKPGGSSENKVKCFNRMQSIS